MMERLHLLIQKYWIEVGVLLPFMVAICFALYGDAYVASWRNFARMTSPWVFTVVFGPIACHWVRAETLQRFPKLDDWQKRIAWGLSGHMLLSVGLALLTFFTLNLLGYDDLIPSESKFYGLLVLIAMAVLISVIFYESATYFAKWKEAISENEQMEKLTLESQYRSLQNQLNPHFLFNSFNVLSSLISESPRQAEDFVDELSNVYRYLLRSNEQELATVGEELRFIRSFFHLLETRHEKGISLETIVNKGVLDKKLPTLSLQVLVENAVKHNEISPEKPLKIEILESGPALIVRNNMQQKATKPLSNQVGLENLRQRYKLLGVAGFAVEDDGRVFSVALPVLG
ncbi:MAG: histidine kinase [Lewinellaceae bacterium]|nr:histidine kinase [Saprospiraceae bacterium]MCB9337541.1 histidine kinase [Lewinellaceae bacterium]